MISKSSDTLCRFFIASHAVTMTKVALLRRTAASQTVNKVSITIDGSAVSDLAAEPSMGGLWSSDVITAFASGLFGDHVVSTPDTGAAAACATKPSSSAAINTTKLPILLWVEFTLGS